MTDTLSSTSTCPELSTLGGAGAGLLAGHAYAHWLATHHPSSTFYVKITPNKGSYCKISIRYPITLRRTRAPPAGPRRAPGVGVRTRAHAIALACRVLLCFARDHLIDHEKGHLARTLLE
ncbi:hypothetical protein EVAR_11696_1 [Eumeta japonica]|uniref:Uncharacterized protein n=1 Tax=Eumeta variegata TaxID=151549 RepID=A0A4C1U4Q9_EUMVA|nr:hypothetical protein EVAR_11696_1 [Eumeta japonica]